MALNSRLDKGRGSGHIIIGNTRSVLARGLVRCLVDRPLAVPARREDLLCSTGYPGWSPAEMMAHVTSSILREHFIVQPAWGIWAKLATSAEIPPGKI
jgi:hypothetical protein